MIKYSRKELMIYGCILAICISFIFGIIIGRIQGNRFYRLYMLAHPFKWIPKDQKVVNFALLPAYVTKNKFTDEMYICFGSDKKPYCLKLITEKEGK
jgi:hypothetical protein